MTFANAQNAWVDTSRGKDLQVLATARQIIAANIYCTLSTCSPDGLPWVSPVFFAYDASWSLYWSSATASRHSQNLAQNQGRAAISIYSTHTEALKGQGLYLSGGAGELESGRVEEIMPRLFQRAGGDPSTRTAADYLGTSPRRIYTFQPETVWITGERLPLGRQLIDTKIELSLTDLLASEP